MTDRIGRAVPGPTAPVHTSPAPAQHRDAPQATRAASAAPAHDDVRPSGHGDARPSTEHPSGHHDAERSASLRGDAARRQDGPLTAQDQAARGAGSLESPGTAVAGSRNRDLDVAVRAADVGDGAPEPDRLKQSGHPFFTIGMSDASVASILELLRERQGDGSTPVTQATNGTDWVNDFIFKQSGHSDGEDPDGDGDIAGSLGSGVDWINDFIFKQSGHSDGEHPGDDPTAGSGGGVGGQLPAGWPGTGSGGAPAGATSAYGGGLIPGVGGAGCGGGTAGGSGGSSGGGGAPAGAN